VPGALVDLAHGSVAAAQALAHLRYGQIVVGLIAEDRGIAVLGGRGQVRDASNSEDLPDDVGNFPQDWFSSGDRHGACYRACTGQSNYERPIQSRAGTRIVGNISFLQEITRRPARTTCPAFEVTAAAIAQGDRPLEWRSYLLGVVT
jgi:hypothetical protein